MRVCMLELGVSGERGLALHELMHHWMVHTMAGFLEQICCGLWARARSTVSSA